MVLTMNATSVETAKIREGADSSEGLTVADAVWVGTAILQRKVGKADRDKGFSTETIVDFVQQLHLTKGAQKSVWQHVNQHCVANRPPQPNRSRMLFALGGGVRRLFRDGDRSDPGRKDAPTHPDWEKLPQQYQDLRRWYEEEWNRSVDGLNDPLLALAGTWKDEPADEYVAHLRENWSNAQ